MNSGYVVTCPSCGQFVEEFSLSDEWFCECGEYGQLCTEIDGDGEIIEDEDDD